MLLQHSVATPAIPARLTWYNPLVEAQPSDHSHTHTNAVARTRPELPRALHVRVFVCKTGETHLPNHH